MAVMGDAWKLHERLVAQYFYTEREKRGADFSISDCDVLVNVTDWHEALGRGLDPCPYTHIVVECKYHSGLKLHEWMRDFSSRTKTGRNPIMFWDSGAFERPEYGICWLEDFEKAWDCFITKPYYTVVEMLEQWTPGFIQRKSPEYLKNWWLQAFNYCCEFSKPVSERDTNFRASDERMLRQKCEAFPVVSVRSNKLKGRLMIWKT